MNTLDPENWFGPVWRRVLAQLHAEMDARHYDLWIAPLRVVSADVELIVIACRTPYVRDRTVDKLGQRIADIIAMSVPNLGGVDFIVDPAPKAPTPPTPRAIRVAKLVTSNLTVGQPPMPSCPAVSAPADGNGDAKASERRVLIEDIKRVVAERNLVSVGDLESRSRKRAIVRLRQMAMLVSRRLTGRSFPEIARRFGARDHTTVIYGCRKIERQVESDPIMAAELAALMRLFMH